MDKSSNYSACLSELSDDRGLGECAGEAETLSSPPVGLVSVHPSTTGKWSMCVSPGNESVACGRPSQGTRTRTGWAGCALHREGTNPWSKWALESILCFTLQALCPVTMLYDPEEGVTLLDFYTETIGSVAPSSCSTVLRNPVFNYVFPLSLSLPSFLQFLQNLTHFTMVSGRFCDEGTLGLDGGVVANPHGSLLTWLQL